jgi:hypothetical protein
MRTKLTAFVVLGLGAVALAAQQDATLLRFNLAENSSHSYTCTLKGNQTVEAPTGPMEIGFNASYEYILKTGAVDKEKNVAEIEMITKDMKFEMTGPMADQAPGTQQGPSQTSTKAKLDHRYRLSDMKMAGASMETMMAMGAASGLSPFIELPEAPVKIGDTWQVNVPKNAMLGTTKDLTLTATFKGDGKLEEKEGHWIVLKGPVPVDMDLGKVMEEMAKANPGSDPTGGMMNGMKMLMKGTMDVEMNAVLDKKDGRILAMVTNIGQKLKMELVDFAMTMDSNGTLQVKMIEKK